MFASPYLPVLAITASQSNSQNRKKNPLDGPSMAGERPIKTNTFLFKQAGNISRDKIELMTENTQHSNTLTKKTYINFSPMDLIDFVPFLRGKNTPNSKLLEPKRTPECHSIRCRNACIHTFAAI